MVPPSSCSTAAYVVELSVRQGLWWPGSYPALRERGRGPKTSIRAWNGTQWDQRSQDLDGVAAHDKFGDSVALSADGMVMAVGVPWNGSGHVQVFDWNVAQWVQRGQDLDGEDDGDFFGSLVALSGNGSVLAVGAPWHWSDVNNGVSGHICVFEWVGLQWIQQGFDLDGEAANDQFGSSVSLSANGDVLAVGAPALYTCVVRV